MPVQSGYASYYKPMQPLTPLKPPASPLAMAASAAPSSANPFGLASNNMRDAQGGYGTASAPVKSAATSPVVNGGLTGQAAAGTPTNFPAAQASAATVPTIAPLKPPATDSLYQGVVALTGESDQLAQADALKQRQQLFEAYGDPNLAMAALNDANVAAVAKGNPTSTVNQINTQYQQGLHNLDEQLNQANLGFSGYRIQQEQQAATDYQNQLANAAAQVNGANDTISSNLAAALGQNQAQRIAALQDATDRAAQAAAAAGATNSGAGSDVPPSSAPIAPTDANGNPIFPNNPHDLPLPGPTGGQTQSIGAAIPPASAPFSLPLGGSVNLAPGIASAAKAAASPSGVSALAQALAGVPASGYGSAAQRRKQGI